MSCRDDVLSLWRAQSGRLRCPLCFGALLVRERSLICPANHTFDVARQGWTSFAAGGRDYDAALWRARRRVIGEGFFDPVIRAAAARLGNPGFFVDAGCGEGSLTARLAGMTGGTALGADLSRDGIRLAAGAHPDHLWAVADLARLPVETGAADAIINLLAPARYDEFIRVLRPGGMLLKAVPTENHLRELRALWGASPSETAGQAEARFTERFPGARSEPVEQTVFAGDWLPALCAMTPLSWHRTAEPPPEGMSVTLSVRVLVTRKGPD